MVSGDLKSRGKIFRKMMSCDTLETIDGQNMIKEQLSIYLQDILNTSGARGSFQNFFGENFESLLWSDSISVCENNIQDQTSRMSSDNLDTWKKIKNFIIGNHEAHTRRV